ncbi:hypothetical protein R6V09_02670 [Streptomyces sp. W16]|uniref:hypothetical protein n=1 Tax=Streptomyces sp. W16 TaxID=3076631 RepID=UPI00295ABA1A|nr:hypothetical protein [Streptomyces sp. W16]MDV9169043.1 hypothetical protein [Streptomyces sp. W16]
MPSGFAYVDVYSVRFPTISTRSPVATAFAAAFSASGVFSFEAFSPEVFSPEDPESESACAAEAVAVTPTAGIPASTAIAVTNPAISLNRRLRTPT